MLLINDHESGAGVILEKSRRQGVLRGTAGGELNLSDIMSDENIEAGETVVTSGGDRIYPKGLPVGTVSNVAPDREDRSLPGHQDQACGGLQPPGGSAGSTPPLSRRRPGDGAGAAYVPRTSWRNDCPACQNLMQRTEETAGKAGPVSRPGSGG